MPQLKPTRGTLIRTSHSLARGLAGCWLLGEGTGEINVSGTYNGITKYASARVYISANITLAKVSIFSEKTSIQVEESITLTVKGFTQFDTEISGVFFTWSVQGDLGLIDNNGVFTAGILPGTEVITVTGTHGGISKTASISITITINVEPTILTIRSRDILFMLVLLFFLNPADIKSTNHK